MNHQKYSSSQAWVEALAHLSLADSVPIIAEKKKDNLRKIGEQDPGDNEV